MHPVLSERSSCRRRCSRTESCLMAGLANVWFALCTTEQFQPNMPSLECCEGKTRRNQNLNLAHQSSRATDEARVRATLAPQGGVRPLLQYRGVLRRACWKGRGGSPKCTVASVGIKGAPILGGRPQLRRPHEERRSGRGRRGHMIRKSG